MPSVTSGKWHGALVVQDVRQDLRRCVVTSLTSVRMVVTHSIILCIFYIMTSVVLSYDQM